MTVRLGEPDQVNGRIESWSVGDLPILKTDMASGYALGVDAAQAKAQDQPRFSIGLQLTGRGRFNQFGVDHRLPTGTLNCADLSEPFDCDWPGAGSSLAVVCMTADQIGLSVDEIRKGARQLHQSPLAGLVARHARQLTTLQREAHPTVTESVAAATIDLCRALLASASGTGGSSISVMRETLVARVQAYVRQNLHDAELTVASIAWAHGLSVHDLRRRCDAQEFSVDEFVVSERHKGAWRGLSDPSDARRDDTRK